MRELFTGIYTRFASTPHSSFYDDISGRLYLEKAPTGTSYPYATYGLVSASHDWTFTEDFEEALIDFQLFSDAAGASEITDMHAHLMAQFDDCNLTVSGYDHVWMQRDMSYLNLTQDQVPEKDIWQYTVEYRVLIQK